jgi:hypothetical protein
MRNGVRLLLATAVLGGGILVAREVPAWLLSAGYFQVETVALEGARFLTAEEARGAAALPEGFPVWGETGEVEARVRAHPLVEEVRVRRRYPGTLVLEVRERVPVALLPTPALVPVDAQGEILPVDPVLHRLDLPLLRPTVRGEGGETPLTPVQRRTLAGEVVRLLELSPQMEASVSEAWLDPWGDVVVALEVPRTTLQFRPPLTAGRLREGMEVLADALERRPGELPQAVDLRFAEQVVVRYARRGSP